MNNDARKITFIVLLSIAAAAFLGFCVLTAVSFLGAENGKSLLPSNVTLWSGIVSAAVLFAVGAAFLIRVFKRDK